MTLNLEPVPLWKRMLNPAHRQEIMSFVLEDTQRLAPLGKTSIVSQNVSRRHHSVLFNTCKWMRVSITKALRCSQVVLDLGKLTTIGCDTLLAPTMSPEAVIDLLEISPQFNATVTRWWKSTVSIGEPHPLDFIKKRQYVWLVSKLIDKLCLDVTPSRRDAMVELDWSLDSCGRRQVFIDTLAAMLHTLSSTWVASSALNKMCEFLTDLYDVVFDVPPMSIVFPEDVNKDGSFVNSSSTLKASRIEQRRALQSKSPEPFPAHSYKRQQSEPFMKMSDGNTMLAFPQRKQILATPPPPPMTEIDDPYVRAVAVTPQPGDKHATGFRYESSEVPAKKLPISTTVSKQRLHGMRGNPRPVNDELPEEPVTHKPPTSASSSSSSPSKGGKPPHKLDPIDHSAAASAEPTLRNAQRWGNRVRRTVTEKVTVVPAPQHTFPSFVPQPKIHNKRVVEMLRTRRTIDKDVFQDDNDDVDGEGDADGEHVYYERGAVYADGDIVSEITRSPSPPTQQSFMDMSYRQQQQQQQQQPSFVASGVDCLFPDIVAELHIQGQSRKRNLYITPETTYADLCDAAEMERSSVKVHARIGTGPKTNVNNTQDIQALVAHFILEHQQSCFRSTTYTPMGQNPTLKAKICRRAPQYIVRVYLIGKSKQPSSQSVTSSGKKVRHGKRSSVDITIHPQLSSASKTMMDGNDDDEMGETESMRAAHEAWETEDAHQSLSGFAQYDEDEPGEDNQTHNTM
eukprot:PhM_4_TR9326/c0_g1_i1/m.20850